MFVNNFSNVYTLLNTLVIGCNYISFPNRQWIYSISFKFFCFYRTHQRWNSDTKFFWRPWIKLLGKQALLRALGLIEVTSKLHCGDFNNLINRIESNCYRKPNLIWINWYHLKGNFFWLSLLYISQHLIKKSIMWYSKKLSGNFY